MVSGLTRMLDAVPFSACETAPGLNWSRRESSTRVIAEEGRFAIAAKRHAASGKSQSASPSVDRNAHSAGRDRNFALHSAKTARDEFFPERNRFFKLPKNSVDHQSSQTKSFTTEVVDPEFSREASPFSCQRKNRFFQRISRTSVVLEDHRPGLATMSFT